MKTIQLTQSKLAIVDDENYESLSKYKWQAIKIRHTYYAVRSVKKPNPGLIYMHRQILNTPIGLKTDHINHNGLDNRLINIRICTPSQNNQNSKCYSKSKSSKYKGVSWSKYFNCWAARIKYNKHLSHIGYFKTEIEAAKAYNEQAIKLFGDFACLNCFDS